MRFHVCKEMEAGCQAVWSTHLASICCLSLSMWLMVPLQLSTALKREREWSQLKGHSPPLYTGGLAHEIRVVSCKQETYLDSSSVSS